MSNVPKNLRYDQTSQSTLAEFLVATQAPEGKSTFLPDSKLDFRFSMSGGYVTSWASSTLDFDLVYYGHLNALGTKDNKYGVVTLDPFLGAHQMIQRITVSVGGNIIEDHRDYPFLYKTQKAMHCNQNKRFIDSLASEEDTAITSKVWRSSVGSTDYYEDGISYRPLVTTDQRSTDNQAKTTSEKRVRCRLNLLSCLGSLSGAKYWPNVLLNSDVRLEIYLNSVYRGAIVADTWTKGTTGVLVNPPWRWENVQFTMSNVRLNTQVINALKSTSSVQMIMPGYSTQSNTLPAISGTHNENLKYSSSASSLKQILLVFRDPADVDQAQRNSYAFLEPMGLTHQFLIGSTLMPARPVTNITDRFREFMRCVGGPANSCEHRTLLRAPNWLFQPTSDSTYGTRVIGLKAAIGDNVHTLAPCHILGQSLEMYADHTLSSVVFSGINAVNLIMQAQLSITNTTTRPSNVPDDKYPGTSVSNNKIAYMVQTIMVYDRLLEFKNGEVVMGY